MKLEYILVMEKYSFIDRYEIYLRQSFINFINTDIFHQT